MCGITAENSQHLVVAKFASSGKFYAKQMGT